MVDPDIGDVYLLAQFDGVDGQTEYNPEIGDYSLVFAGSAELTDSLPNFGDTTLSVGSGNTVTVGSAGDYDFLHDGTEDYTIELFFVSLGADGQLLSNLNFSSFHGVSLSVNAGKLQYSIFAPGFTAVALVETGASDIGSVSDVYYYVAITHTVSGGLELFLDAVSKDTDTLSSPSGDAGGSFIIGGQFDHKVEGLRITRGTARTITTVPTEPFDSGFETIIASGGPLQLNQRFLAASQVAQILSASPLGQNVEMQAASQVAQIQGPSPLGRTVSMRMVIDFEKIPGSDVNNVFTMQITGSPVLTIPIKSWQATLQTGRSNYLQCVLPNTDDFLAELSARQNTEEIIVYKGAVFEELSVEMELARVPLQQINQAEGPTNNTITVSGYSTGYEVPDAPISQTMQGVRSRNITAGGDVRARGEIDWYLRPGDTIDIKGTSITADYINYYVIQNQDSVDAYMDVGTRG